MACQVFMNEIINTKAQRLHPVAWNRLWSLPIPFKIIVFLWKICTNCLSVRSLLHRQISKVASYCPLCCTEKENLEHLFFLCPFARVIWFGFDLSIRTNELALHKAKDWIQEWLLKHELTHSNAFQFYEQFFYILWNIWKHRNIVIFQDQVPNSQGVLCQVKCQMRQISKAIQEHASKQDILDHQQSISSLQDISTCSVPLYDNDWTLFLAIKKNRSVPQIGRAHV